MIGLVAGAYGIGQIILRTLGHDCGHKGRTKISLLIGVMTPAVASLIRILNPSGGGFLLLTLCQALVPLCGLYLLYFCSVSRQRCNSAGYGSSYGGERLWSSDWLRLQHIVLSPIRMSFLCWLSVIAAAGATALALSFVLNKSSEKTLL